MMRSLQSVLLKPMLGVVMLFLLPVNAFPVIHQISMVNFSFSPPNTHINVGDTVRWTNNSISNHTSTSDTRIWSSGVVAPSQSYSRQFLTAGIFPYQCSVHVAFGMRDTIHVTTTGVDDPNSAIPGAYELAQNYPNPFNAQTTIQYDLPVESDVTLSVFDVLGRKIGTLVDEQQSAGHHQVVWNAADSPSGFYFYRIEAGEFSQIKRATLLK